MSVNSILVISMIPVIIYQQYLLLLILLHQMLPSEARDFLVLTTPLPTTPQPGMSYHDYVSSFSNTYWVHLLGFVIIMFILYKCVFHILHIGINTISDSITSTDMIIQIVGSRTSVYVKIMSLEGMPELLSIRSNARLTDLQITGYLHPRINYMWQAIFVHDLTDITTVLTPFARITLYQAFLLRTIMAKKYCTFIYFKCITKQFNRFYRHK